MRVIRLFLILLTLSSTALAQRWPDDTAERLSTGKVVLSGPLSDSVEDWDGSNPYLLLTLDSGFRAVFRSEDEPWGSVAEICGYHFDRQLGTQLVPPTVTRTLRREELPERWPWKTETRTGSLQLFVEGARPASKESISADDLANSEILNFVLGRYDNHSGNLLVDPQRRAVMIDLEGMLDHQKVKYGDFPYLKRGGRFESPLSVSAELPFPFDQPHLLVDPTLEEIHRVFGPWWGQYWSLGMESLYQLLNGIPERTVPYVIWDDRLWVQVRVKSRHPSRTDYYPSATIEALERLDLATVSGLLTPPFERSHALEILERRDEILKAAKSRFLTLNS